MYQDLRISYWWYEMKHDVEEYIALCDTCQRVKAEHKRPKGLLQPLKVSVWKWEETGMYFIIGLPETQKGYLGYRGPINQSHSFHTSPQQVELYISRIICLHGVPKKIMSDRGTQFTSKFWERLHESMDTKLNFSSAYHP
jgi:hypothetical protein